MCFSSICGFCIPFLVEANLGQSSFFKSFAMFSIYEKSSFLKPTKRASKNILKFRNSSGFHVEIEILFVCYCKSTLRFHLPSPGAGSKRLVLLAQLHKDPLNSESDFPVVLASKTGDHWFQVGNVNQNC